MKSVSGTGLRVELHDLRGAMLVVPVGTLDTTTHAELRDILLKCTASLPDAVVVDLRALRIADRGSLSVLATVWLRQSTWPAVPMAVVAGRDAHRALLAAGSVARFLPVRSTVDAALHALDGPPERHRCELELPRSTTSATLARRLVRRTCARWNADPLVVDAELVATELVENTLRHTVSAARLRLEWRSGLLTVAVCDDDPRQAVLREPAATTPNTHGLRLVAQLTKAWGCTPTLEGGKVVWAVLRMPRQRAPHRTVSGHGD